MARLLSPLELAKLAQNQPELLERYDAPKNLKALEIAKFFGVNKSTISRRLQKADIPTGKDQTYDLGDREIQKALRTLTPKTEKSIEYRKRTRRGATLEEVAKENNMKKSDLVKAAKKLGLPTDETVEFNKEYQRRIMGSENVSTQYRYLHYRQVVKLFGGKILLYDNDPELYKNLFNKLYKNGIVLQESNKVMELLNQEQRDILTEAMHRGEV